MKFNPLVSDTCAVMELIVCHVQRRGSGTEDSPVRILTQFYTKNGELVTEIDPLVTPLTPEAMADLMKHSSAEEMKATLKYHKINY